MHEDFAIALVGIGIERVSHITLEAIAVLQRCSRGFVAGFEQPSVNEFCAALMLHLKHGESLPPLHSLSQAYRQDRLRRENYFEATEIVIAAAQSQRPVAYLTPGHPTTYDRVAREILARAESLNLPTRIVAGISSIDTVLVDFRQEPGPGLQIYEASCFVGAGVQPDTRFGCLLMQVGVFGTDYAVIGRAPDARSLGR